MSIAIPGLSASTKTPAVYLNVILGGPGTSAGAAPETILLIGNKLETNISEASPVVSVSVRSAVRSLPGLTMRS